MNHSQSDKITPLSIVKIFNRIADEMYWICDSTITKQEADQSYAEKLKGIEQLSKLCSRLKHTQSLSESLNIAHRILDEYREGSFKLGTPSETDRALGSHIEQLKNTIDTERIHRENELESNLNSIMEKFESLESKADEVLSNIENFSSERMTEMLRQKDEMDRLLSDTATDALSKDYIESSVRERNAANQYREKAIKAMYCAAAAALLVLLFSLGSGLTLAHAIVRALFLIIATAPAAYFSKESSKHREYQHLYEQTYLDLRSVSPYLAPLSAEAKERVMSELALKIFAYRKSSGKNEQTDDAALHTVISRLLDKIPSK